MHPQRTLDISRSRVCLQAPSTHFPGAVSGLREDRDHFPWLPSLHRLCGKHLKWQRGWYFVRRLLRYYGRFRLLTGVDGRITVFLPLPTLSLREPASLCWRTGIEDHVVVNAFLSI